MRASILSIGSELLQGFLTDTNSTHLSRALNAIGVEVVSVFHVGDDLDALKRALQRGLEDADLVVCTGGIGPTDDDLTREAVAAICGEQPTVDPETLEVVRAFFRRRGAEMPEKNSKQAWIIPSAEILPNPAGTAPGWFVRTMGKTIVLMPGVPREMMRMWVNEAIPRLAPMLQGDAIKVQTLKTIGIGESAVEQLLAAIINRGYPTVSTYAKNDGVHIRIFAMSADPDEAARALQSTEDEIRSILGASVYGDLSVSLPHAVLDMLATSGREIVIWEAGTGGQVVSLLTSDDSVAHVVREARVCRLPRTLGTPTGRRDAVDVSRRGVASLDDNACDTLYRMGVTAIRDERDQLGRYDARIGIVVVADGRESINTYRLAAAPGEIGRRASLLAAEFLRQTILDSISLHQG